MIDKDFELAAETFQEMSYEDKIRMDGFLMAWDIVEEIGMRFDPYPVFEERDLDKSDPIWN